jgi:hypothetical protein
MATQNVNPGTKINIPVIPPLAKGDGGISPPLSPRRQFINNEQNKISAPRSPGRMTLDEEEQLRVAIQKSLDEANLLMRTTPTVITDRRDPLYSPVANNDFKDTEDVMIQEAIKASVMAADQANLAKYHLNKITLSPGGEPPLSPRTLQRRQLMQKQDIEYEESVRIDTEKAKQAREAAEAAQAAAIAAEVAANKIKEALILEENKKALIQPPVLIYSLDNANDILLLRFKLPSGGTVNHSFHKREPLSSLIQQLRFDLKHLGDFVLTLQHSRKVIICTPDTSLEQCGFINRGVVIVEYP